MSNIKKGDVVYLKSGGPAMTVQNIDSNEVVCIWFNNDNEQALTKIFDIEALKISKDTKQALGTVSSINE